MSEFRTSRIEPSLENIVDIHSMLTSQQRALSGDTRTVKSALEIRQSIQEAPDSYRGAFDGANRLVAVARFSDWRRTDQLAFESLRAQFAYRLERRKEDQALEGNPMGIFALASFEGLGLTRAIEATELLLDRIIEDAPEREIRIARFYDYPSKDPGWWSTNSRGFRGTGKFGHVAGTLRELAIRPAVAELDEALAA